jgi:hypothetical protein
VYKKPCIPATTAPEATNKEERSTTGQDKEEQKSEMIMTNNQ